MQSVAVIFVFALATVANAALRHSVKEGELNTTITTTAQNNEPKEFKNHEAALRGYNVFEGDPFSAYVDPGWCHMSIFEATVRDNATGTIRFQDAINAYDVLTCRGLTAKSTATTSTNYTSLMIESTTVGTKIGFDLSKFVPGGDSKIGKFLGPFSLKDSSTDGYEKKANFFAKEKGELVMLTADCQLYELSISSYVQPAFTPIFKGAVKELWDVTDAAREVRMLAMQDFVHSFGTHYASVTVFGARMASISAWMQSDRDKYTSDELGHCTTTEGSAFLGITIEPSSKKCRNSTTTKGGFHSKYMKRLTQISYGSKPKEDILKWADQEFDMPVPVRMELKPVLTLLTPENVRLIDASINQTALVQWMAEYYINYCELFNIDCGIFNQTGCGITGACGPHESCTNDETLPFGVRCEQQLQRCGDPGVSCKSGFRCVDKPDGAKGYTCLQNCTPSLCPRVREVCVQDDDDAAGYHCEAPCDKLVNISVEGRLWYVQHDCTWDVSGGVTKEADGKLRISFSGRRTTGSVKSDFCRDDIHWNYWNIYCIMDYGGKVILDDRDGLFGWTMDASGQEIEIIDKWFDDSVISTILKLRRI